MSEHFQECGDSQWEKRVTEGFVQSRCLRTHDYKTGYILAGDSHAEHLLIGLTASSPGASFAYATRVGLPLLSNLGFFQFFEAVAQDQSIPPELLKAVELSKNKGLPLTLLAITHVDVVIKGADKTLFDPQQRFQLRYALPLGGAYLFRPDQHVCGRWLQVDATRLLSSLQLAVMQ